MTLTLRFHKYLFIILFILFSPILSSADEFEILSVKGLVELSTDQKNWQKASPPQKINSGTWIRTGPSASAAPNVPRVGSRGLADLRTRRCRTSMPYS